MGKDLRGLRRKYSAAQNKNLSGSSNFKTILKQKSIPIF